MTTLTAQNVKTRIIEERDLLRKALANEHASTQKVYEAREALKRTEDVIIQEIQDNPANKNEKDRTAAKRMARINDGRYIAGLKAISDAEIERFNFQASIIDHQTRIQVFTADYEFSLLGRRDAQFQFALQLAKVVQADTTVNIEVTAPKLTATPNTDKNLTDLNTQHRAASGIPEGYQINADLIHSFMDTTEGRAIIADWLREHGKPVMAQVLESGIQDINSAVVIADTPVGEPVLMTRIDDIPGEHVDDAMTQILTEEVKKDIVTALHNDNDPNNPTSQGNHPAANMDLPEGVELKSGVLVCATCGMMVTMHADHASFVHPPNDQCLTQHHGTVHSDAKLRKPESKNTGRVGSVDV
jgi:hypothetical protein